MWILLKNVISIKKVWFFAKIQFWKFEILEKCDFENMNLWIKCTFLPQCVTIFLLHFLFGCNKQIIEVRAVAALFDTYTRNLYFSKRQRLTLQLIFLSPFFVPVILTHYLKSPIFAWKLVSFIFVKLDPP